MDIEPTEPVHTLELAKAIERDLASSGDELKKLSSLFLVKGADSAPEPLDLGRRGRVVVVLCVVLPIVYIDIRKTGDEELELLLVENCNQFCRDNVMETYLSLAMCGRNLEF